MMKERILGLFYLSFMMRGYGLRFRVEWFRFFVVRRWFRKLCVGCGFFWLFVFVMLFFAVWGGYVVFVFMVVFREIDGFKLVLDLFCLIWLLLFIYGDLNLN